MPVHVVQSNADAHPVVVPGMQVPEMHMSPDGQSVSTKHMGPESKPGPKSKPRPPPPRRPVQPTTRESATTPKIIAKRVMGASVAPRRASANRGVTFSHM